MRQSEPKKHGKKDAAWRKVRAAWVINNPPSHEEQYVCGICGTSVHKDDMELDHINPRSSAFLSKDDETNLQPTHSRCNRLKGSVHVKPIVTTLEYALRKKLDL